MFCSSGGGGGGRDGAGGGWADALMPDMGEGGRLGADGGNGGPISDKLDCIVLPRDFCDKGGFGNGADGVGVSVISSAELSVRLESTDSLPGADGREGVDVGTGGVGEEATVREVGGLSEAGRGSAGEGKLWITFNRSLLVRIAGPWIIATWCAKLGKIAGIRRGVKGTMTSCAKLRNSASQRSAVDC